MELSSTTIIILSLVILVIYAYKTLTKHHNFFKLRGIECIKPTILFGNMYEAFRDGENFENVVEEFYKKFRNEKLFGIFNFLRPVIVIKDVDLINQITTQHTNKFKNRDHLNIDDILSKSLFLLQDNQADDLRKLINPFFEESTNWREQHHVKINSCADDLIKYYYRELSEAEEAIIDTKDVFEKFYSNVIAMSVLGIERNCNYDRKSRVYEIAHEIQKNLTSTSGILKILAMNICPLFKLKVLKPMIYDFLRDCVTSEIKNRKIRKKFHNDFLQLFVDSKKEWSDEVISAQVVSFLTAGFSTTSALFQACCFVFVRSEKLRRENKTSEFFDKFIYEVLRKVTPISMTSRICSENCIIRTKSGEIFKIFKGDLIEFPLRLIQNDHINFNDPQAINLHRKENSNLSFGLNRSCIGEKFAIFIIKTLLMKLFQNFEIQSCDKTPYDLNFSDRNYENVFIKLKLNKKHI